MRTPKRRLLTTRITEMSELKTVGELVRDDRLASKIRALVYRGGTLELEEPAAPSCSACHDAGWLRLELSISHENFGKPSECLACGVVAQRRRERLVRESGIDASMLGFTLESYAERTGKRALVEKIRGHIDAAAIVLVGPVGVGKTGISAALLLNKISEGQRARMISAPSFFARLRSTYDRRSDSADGEREADVLADLATVPMLGLDDIGRGTISEWGQERLFSLVCSRLATPGLRTIVTSNLDGDGQGLADHVWPATFDRLRGAAKPFIRISGESLRGVA